MMNHEVTLRKHRNVGWRMKSRLMALCKRTLDRKVIIPENVEYIVLVFSESKPRHQHWFKLREIDQFPPWTGQSRYRRCSPIVGVREVGWYSAFKELCQINFHQDRKYVWIEY